MDIDIGEERNGEVLILVPTGRLDSANAHSFESVVMDHVGNGVRRLIVDFSRLDFVSSSGSRVLLMVAQALKAEAGTLVLCSMKDHIREVFDVSGFSRIIPIRDSREEALTLAPRPRIPHSRP